MPSHYCIDPQDQYSQAELLVEFEGSVGSVKLVSARDDHDVDVLAYLEDAERLALTTEIDADYLQDAMARGRRVPRHPIPFQS